MDVEGAIRSRRSIRRYQNKDVSDSLVRELLDLARHAPSSMNGQPWHFTVVRGDQTKKKLVQIKNKYCPASRNPPATRAAN
jgi:nitroreductase